MRNLNTAEICANLIKVELNDYDNKLKGKVTGLVNRIVTQMAGDIQHLFNVKIKTLNAKIMYLAGELEKTNPELLKGLGDVEQETWEQAMKTVPMTPEEGNGKIKPASKIIQLGD